MFTKEYLYNNIEVLKSSSEIALWFVLNNYYLSLYCLVYVMFL